MITATTKMSHRHQRALTTGNSLTSFFLDMYRPRSQMVSPKKIIRVLNEAQVSFVLMGTHGLSGWRSRARATEDVDFLVAKKDHGKAVKALQKAFPKFPMEDGPILTRFKDPVTGEPRIDLMKPLQKVYQMVFRHTKKVADSYRIPDLEMALVSKFAAMVSPNRDTSRKIQDTADFADILVHNQKEINRKKLNRLADQVYRGGSKEITQLAEDILAGRRIQV